MSGLVIVKVVIVTGARSTKPPDSALLNKSIKDCTVVRANSGPIREQNRRCRMQTNTTIIRIFRLLIHVSCASPSSFWTSSWLEASPPQQSVPASSDLQPVSRQHLQQVTHTWSPDIDVLGMTGHLMGSLVCYLALHSIEAKRRSLSFPFLSFPFLSFPFLSFPFLSFPFSQRPSRSQQPCTLHSI